MVTNAIFFGSLVVMSSVIGLIYELRKIKQNSTVELFEKTKQKSNCMLILYS
jgi:hypothetical protein